MSAEHDLYAALAADATVVTLLNDVAQRAYPDALPEETDYPAVVYSRADTEIFTTIHSSAQCAERAIMSVQCIDEVRDGADVLADAVRDALTTANFVIAGRVAGYVVEVEKHVVELTFDYFS